MVIARFEFKASSASYFVDGGDNGQTVVEICFESVEALISCAKEFEESIENCTAIIGDQIIDLKSLTGA